MKYSELEPGDVLYNDRSFIVLLARLDDPDFVQLLWLMNNGEISYEKTMSKALKITIYNVIQHGGCR